MLCKCKKCHQEKELNVFNFKTTKVKGKIYFEKTCKACRHNAAKIRAKERYTSDPVYKQKKIDSTNKCLKQNAGERNETWLRRLSKTKEWKKLNSEKVKTTDKRRNAKRWKDPRYKISKTMSNQLNKHIKDKKRTHVFHILGYSLDQLMKHLESKFAEGMSWDNHGDWHIDHIIPVCFFNIKSKNDADFKKCWALDNLRPLWAEDNLKKSHLDKKMKS